MFLLGCSPSPRVVLYCAHDREFAQPILDEFQRETGITVLPRFDTEANKSVGLYEDLVREAKRPRCDVHWNNEILATIRLQNQGILAPYSSPATDAFPEQFRAKDQTWTAFAARARVILINREKLPDEKDWPKSLAELAAPRFKNRVAFAKPMFGTTATQAALLFASLGEDVAMNHFRALRVNGVRILSGNKQVAVAVGRGEVAVGITDTDDALAELAQHRPVEMVFPTSEKDGNGGLVVIPNTVALVKNCQNPELGKKLIDFLLSPAVETKLALGPAGQIPLNPTLKNSAKLPATMDPVWKSRWLKVDFQNATLEWEKSQQFLIQEFSLR